jgi:beta-galactosidase
MFYFGVDYYPEHWPESRWETDARMMQDAGFNVVRMAEFAWSLMEPEDGIFDFDWLDRAVDMLAKYDIRVVLGTPSAAVPPWIWEKIPDLALVDENGVAWEYGSRRDYSPTNPAYRAYAVRIAKKMAEHYKDHPSIIGWQIDNEFGDRCYSPGTRLAFQQWLKRKYQSLEQLNACWGTRFWSHVYTDWSQIPVPLKTIHGQHNPGLHLDYYRFMSDVYVEFQQLQIDAIREVCPPEQFITHNLMGFGYPKIDYFDLADSLDFVTWDNYPRGFWITKETIDPAPLALSHTMMRSLKKKNFWVMEQQSGQGAWNILPPLPRPGEIALWAYQAVAHGADGIVFFRWRTARHGTEQYWHGVLDHDATPRRRYAEVKQMGTQIARIGSVLAGTETRAEVALLHSYDTRFAFQVQQNNPDFSYERHSYDYFAALHAANVAVDIVSPEETLEQYKLVIVPSLYVAETETVQRLKSFAESGGIVIITARSGVKDHSNAVVDMALPGLLASLCAVEVDEYDSLLSGHTRKLNFATSELMGSGKAAIWCDILNPDGATVLVEYAEDFYAGRAAVVKNDVGRGQVIYVGTIGDSEFVESIVHYALNISGIQPPLLTPDRVEAAIRWQDDKRLLFLLNHGDVPAQLTLDSNYLDLVTETEQSGEITLAPKRVMILT